VSANAVSFTFPNNMSRELNVSNFTMSPTDSFKVLYLGTIVNGVRTPPKITLSWENPPEISRVAPKP